MADNVFIPDQQALPTDSDTITKRISWASILAGVVVVLIVQLALSLLGIGIGASTMEPLTEQNPVQGVGTGSGIWLLGSMIITKIKSQGFWALPLKVWVRESVPKADLAIFAFALGALDLE